MTFSLFPLGERNGREEGKKKRKTCEHWVGAVPNDVLWCKQVVRGWCRKEEEMSEEFSRRRVTRDSEEEEGREDSDDSQWR